MAQRGNRGKGGGSSSRGSGDYAGRVLGHGDRLRIWLYMMDQDKASPSMCAEALGLNLPRCSHHVRELEKAKVIRAAGTRPRRGATEHFYRAVKTPTEVFERIVEDERKKVRALAA